MADHDLIIIGAGLSGLAAGIRSARFGRKTLILERHQRVGGLNSWYRRGDFLLETGLHAMTNFAPPGDKQAPLNRLFRQLKLPRKAFPTHEQIASEILFPDHRLVFSNDPALLEEEIAREFPVAIDRFRRLRAMVADYDSFTPAPWRSTRALLRETLGNRRLEDMLLLPLMVYGNSEEHDMDLAQFAIMFRALFEEGFFRPGGTMRDFLDALLEQYRGYGGELRTGAGVVGLERAGERVRGVLLEGGERLGCNYLLSTVGLAATAELIGWDEHAGHDCGRMSFVETITVLPRERRKAIRQDRTIIFYNRKPDFDYCRPQEAVDVSWGVICFPENFQGLAVGEHIQVRVTNSASYPLWRAADPAAYAGMKARWGMESARVVGEIIGNYQQDSVYQDSFTPVTIERFTGKAEGAVYGAPRKIKDGRTPLANLFIAGTDQGFLGIVGAMLSGVSMVNQHVLLAE